MANANFFSPDGGITRYPLEDAEARNRIDNNFQLLRDGEVIEGKNKLEITGSSSYTEGGVRFVVNSDKSVTVDTNGVASSANARFVLQMPIKHLVNGEEYVISGTPNDIDGTKAYVGISDWNTTSYDDTTGEGAEFTMFNPESYPNARIYIFVKSGTTLSNKVFKPMICTSADWNKSHTYEPYYVPLKDSKLDIVDQQVVGAWNLLQNTGTTQVINSEVTFTVNADKTVSTAGTYSGSDAIKFYLNSSISLKAGVTYTLSGNAKVCSSYTEVRIDLIDAVNEWVYQDAQIISGGIGVGTHVCDMGYGVTFIPNNDVTVKAVIRVFSGQNTNGLTFKPMLALQPNTPYIPWCMTNRELTDGLTAIAGALVDKGELDSTNDLNNIDAQGIYHIKSKPTNSPTQWSPLIVYRRNAADIRQIIYGNDDNIYTRQKGGSPATWASWVKFTGTVVS